MWCEKCHYGHESYNFDHCGYCQSTKLTKKNPFDKKANQNKTKKKYESSPKKREDTTHDDIVAITSGKMKPTAMR